VRWLALPALLVFLGCGGGASNEAAAPLVAMEPAGAECAVCGMVVREQPSPRGQVVHRDGEHAFLCSLGDLRAYVQAPGPRGEPVATFVEALPAGHDLSKTDTAAQPWTAAADAHYLVGFDRPGVMGLPIGSFSSEEGAALAASALSGRQATWNALRTTPFNELPVAESQGASGVP
jgi:copper chaperone NosL